MKKIILLILFIYLSNNYFSQQVLKGAIKDSLGNCIPFVSIRVLNSTYGTVSNGDGVYSLTLKKGKYVIQYSAFGFKNQTDSIQLNFNDVIKDIVLHESLNELEEVIVKSFNRKEKGKEIIKNAIEKRPIYNQNLNKYKCETYCFSSLEKVKQDSIIKDSIIKKEKLNIVEWWANSFYEFPFKFKDEFIAFNDLTDYNKSFRINNQHQSMSFDVGANVSIAPENGITSNPYLFIESISDIHFSIYDNLINSPRVTQNPLISPISYNALMYYDFWFEQSFYDSTNSLIYEISIKPKFLYESLFFGKIYIKDNSWDVVSYDLGINQKSLMFLNEIRIICDYENNSERSYPIRREFVYNIKEGKNKINGIIKIYQNKYEFDLKSINWLETSIYKKDALKQDSTYWNSKRPFSLKQYEKKFIENQDSIIKSHETDEYLKKMDSIRNEFRLLQVFLGGFSHVNSFKKYEILTNPLSNQIIPFGIGGIRYCINFSLQKEFNNGKILNLKPSIDYGFLNKDIKGSFESSLMYNRMNFSKLGFTVGDVYDVVNNTQNMLTSFVPTNRVRNKKIEFFFSRELFNGLYFKISELFSEKTSIDNLKYPNWMDYFGTAQPNQSFDKYKILLSTIDFEYRIRQKYIIIGNKKIAYKSIFPIFYLTYKKGIPNIFNSMSNFDYLEFKIEQNFHLNTVGVTNVKFNSGNFIQKKNLHIIEHRFFRPSDQLYFSNPINTLQLLDTSLNTSNSYLQFNFIHHFNGFFLNKIILLNKLKLEETFGGSFLSLPSSKYSQFELFVGLERKVRIKKSIFKVGIYLVNSNNSLNQSILHHKIGLNLYNVFFNRWDY
jgi:hypothetical protein